MPSDCPPALPLALQQTQDLPAVTVRRRPCPPPPPPATAGLLAERYRLDCVFDVRPERHIALGTDVQTGARVVIKTAGVRPSVALGAAFAREAALLRRCQHIGLPRFHALLDTDAGPALITEYVPGDSLRAVRDRGRHDEALILDVAHQLSDVLEMFRHVGVVHGAIHPDHILVAPTAAGHRIVLVDLAHAHSPSTPGGGRPGNRGIEDYLAPEQLAGAAGDHRSDLYALGAVLYEMVVGRPTASSHRLLELIGDLLSHDPAGRPASALEFRLALARQPRKAGATGSGDVDALAARMPSGGSRRGAA